MQDCWFVFNRCAQKYTGHVDNPAWFMSLYQGAIKREFIDMASSSTKARTVVAMSDLVIDDDDEPSYIVDAVGETANAGELACTLRQAPSEIKTVLAILLNAPTEILELVSDAFNTGVKGKAASNRYLCMLIGIPEETDLLGRVRDYFG